MVMSVAELIWLYVMFNGLCIMEMFMLNIRSLIFLIMFLFLLRYVRGFRRLKDYFRFFNIFAEQERFYSIVEIYWSYEVRGIIMFYLWEKFKNCENFFKDMFRQV